jgi:hypothetical protein
MPCPGWVNPVHGVFPGVTLSGPGPHSARCQALQALRPKEGSVTPVKLIKSNCPRTCHTRGLGRPMSYRSHCPHTRSDQSDI